MRFLRKKENGLLPMLVFTFITLMVAGLVIVGDSQPAGLTGFATSGMGDNTTTQQSGGQVSKSAPPTSSGTFEDVLDEAVDSIVDSMVAPDEDGNKKTTVDEIFDYNSEVIDSSTGGEEVKSQEDNSSVETSIVDYSKGADLGGGVGAQAVVGDGSLSASATCDYYLGDDNCSLEIKTAGTYCLNGDMTCGGDFGVVINTSGVVLDCQRHIIEGISTPKTGGVGIDSAGSGGVIKNCVITDFDSEIVTNGISSCDITGNSIGNSGFYDVNFIDSSNCNVSGNSFYSSSAIIEQGTSSNNNFCVDNVGNFYATGSEPTSGDCGFAMTFPAQGTVINLTPADYSIAPEWTAQGSADTVFYEVWWDTNFEDIYPDYDVRGPIYGDINDQNDTKTSVVWLTDDTPGTEYTINVTAYANSGTFGIIKGPSVQVSGQINSTDVDSDGKVSWEFGGDDCNDTNPVIHPDVVERCDSTADRRVDYNCDGNAGWGDIECSPPYFSRGSFTSGQDGTTDWNALNNPAYTSISGFTLNNSNGQIVFGDVVSIGNMDLSDVTIGNNLIDVQTSALTGIPANITFWNLAYEHEPIIYHNGAVCTDCTIIEYASRVKVSVPGFSNYTTGPNANLAIWDDGEEETIETHHAVRFYANYTDVLDNSSIDNRTAYDRGVCTFLLTDADGNILTAPSIMEYNAYLGRYSFTADVYNFTLAGTYSYNISCSADDYETVNLTDSVNVVEDTTPPLSPTLYPQIWIHPSNNTYNQWTEVYGYIGEPEVNMSISVRSDEHYFLYNITSSFSETDSVNGGSSVTISQKALEGQNQTFFEWTADTEALLDTYGFIEFTNHDKLGYLRYEVYDYAQLGEEILVEFNESLQSDIPVGTSINLYDGEHPAGWFYFNLTDLRAGSNKIQVWGMDLDGNEGNASIDYINYPYGGELPPSPDIWVLPDVTMGDIDVIGILNLTVLDDANISIVAKNGDLLNFTVEDSSSLRRTSTDGQSEVSSLASEGASYVFISGGDENLFTSPNQKVGFANHNRDYWQYYNVTLVTGPAPGEDKRVYISPALESSVPLGTVIYLYNDSVPRGWFNITLGSDYLHSDLSNEIYAVATNDNGEGPASTSDYVFYDVSDPEFVTEQPDHSDWLFWEGMPNFASYNLEDSYGISEYDHFVRWHNGTNSTWYVTDALWSDLTNASAITSYLTMKGYDLSNDTISETQIACSGAQTNLSCSVDFNESYATYTLYVFAQDLAGRSNLTTLSNVIAQEGGLGITDLSDHGDVTNLPEINATWVLEGNPSMLSHYQFSVGTAQYPSSGWGDSLSWTNTSDAGVFLDKNNLSFQTSTVYYITIRAVSISGGFGTPVSSDGILFIDSTPPVCSGTGCVLDDGTWTDRSDQLHIVFNFTDDESDIVLYEYAIGTDVYPNAGYDSILTRHTTSAYDFTRPGLSMADGQQYFISAKARNGNLIEGFNGTWSPWYNSDGITVDISSPTGGWIDYPSGSTIEDSISINYSAGNDSISGVASAHLLKSTAPLGTGLDNTCGSFSAYSEDRALAVIDGTIGAEIFNLTTGYCYAFKILITDRAGNSVQFGSADYSINLSVDNTPPTDIISVVDDGFHTYVKDQLYASWTSSSDDESGVAYYRVVVKGKMWNDSADCTQPNQCTPAIFNQTSTNPSILASGFTTEHNWKYYFEVTPFNGLGLAGNPAYSDGILYIDVMPPDPVTITSVNNDTTNYYKTDNSSIEINFTGEENMYCVLTFDDRDFDDSAHQCPEVSAGVYSCSNSTVGKLDTDEDTSSDGQGLFSWSITCRDENGNAQNSGQNFEVLFDVDWPDAPEVEDIGFWKAGFYDVVELLVGETVEHTLTYRSDGSDVDVNITFLEYDSDDSDAHIVVSSGVVSEDYYNVPAGSVLTFTIGSNVINIFVDALSSSFATLNVMLDELIVSDLVDPDSYVRSDVRDNDGVYDIVSINKSLFKGDELVSVSDVFSAEILDDTRKGLFDYINITDASRGNNITYKITLSDGIHTTTRSKSTIVSNTQPQAPNLTYSYPAGDVISGNTTFSWFSAVDDDNDFMTYYLEIDNESSPNFSGADLAQQSYSIATTVSRVGTTSTSVDIYQDLIVYEDNRSGSYDIYLYNISSGIEIQLTATGTKEERAPQIYGNYLIFDKDDTLTLYSLSEGTTTSIVTEAGMDEHDYALHNNLITYSVSDGTHIYDIVSGTELAQLSSLKSCQVASYGTNSLITSCSGDVDSAYIYDQVAQTTNLILSGYGALREPALYGDKAVIGTTSSLIIFDISQGSIISTIASEGRNADIYGDVVVYDLFASDELYSYSISKDSSVLLASSSGRPAVFAELVAFKDITSEDMVVSRSVTPMPTVFSVGGAVTSTSVDTTLSLDYPAIGSYSWRIKACDSAGLENSCVYSDTQTFTIDNTAPEITVENPAEQITTSGVLTLLTDISDNYYGENNLTAYYTVYKSSGDVFKTTTPLTYPGFDGSIDFTSLSGTSTQDFRIEINTSDPQGNSRTYVRNISINPSAPNFDFDTFNGNDKVIQNLIDEEFSVANVLSSSLKIIGPLESPVQRYQSSQNNDSLSFHEYDVYLSSASWPEGEYTIIFSASNPVSSAEENRTFIVDNSNPVAVYNVTVDLSGSNLTSVRASDTVAFRTAYEDFSLTGIGITFNDSNNVQTYESGSYTSDDWPTGLKVFQSSYVSMAAFINQTYCWNSSATDGLLRVSSGNSCFDVINDAPTVRGVMALSAWNEGMRSNSTNSVYARNLSRFFSDSNQVYVGSTLMDNLSIVCAGTQVSGSIAEGIIDFYQADSNWHGTEEINCTATDRYGASVSMMFNVTVISVNDPPEISGGLTNLYCGEDTHCEFNLSEYAHDNDTSYGYESLNWSITSVNDSSLASLSIDNSDQVSKYLIVDPSANRSGSINVSLRLLDYLGTDPTREVILHITEVNDAPFGLSLTDPSSGDYVGNDVTVQWTADDVESNSLNYTLEYSDDGGSSWNFIDNISHYKAYVWDSTGIDATVSIRLNASDGSNVTSYTTPFTFTLDNTAPVFTSGAYPFNNSVTLSDNVSVNITTDTSANCVISINGTELNRTYSTTLHTAVTSVAGLLSYGDYGLTFECEDSAGNPAVLHTTFKKRNDPVTFEGLEVTPKLAYVGQPVSLSFRFSVISNLQALAVKLYNASSVEVESFNLPDFTPISNLTNEISLNISSYADVGNYSVFIDDVDCVGCSYTWSDLWLNDSFAVYPRVDQTVNLE